MPRYELIAKSGFAAGDELFVVVENSTTGDTEIGIVTIGGADGFNGVGETYEHIATVDLFGTLTTAQISASIDFIA
jgi:hypothetical protein